MEHWDVLILPEGLIPIPLTSADADEARSALRDLATKVGSPIVFGAPGETEAGGGLTNSAYLMSAEGNIVQKYDKVRLVPGMESGAYSRGTGG